VHTISVAASAMMTRAMTSVPCTYITFFCV
jgi:hypothetical protein